MSSLLTTFYPGPSKIYGFLPQVLQTACEEGILSINHRSNIFMDMMQQTLALLKEKLNIPQDYTIVFTSSATECWEIIAQSFTTQASYHLYNGAFGKKWFEYAQKIHPKTTGFEFELEEVINIQNYDIATHAEVICITQNETSNGTQVKSPVLKEIREKFPNTLIAIDVTSSLGGIMLDWEYGDIWFASVQKCLGLPAGLGILICSPKAVDKALVIKDEKYYNSYLNLYQNIQKFQTPYTPNVLDIFLLKVVLENVAHIQEIHQKILARSRAYMQFFSQFEAYSLLIKQANVRSDTVMVLQSTAENIKILKAQARDEGITLGNGYGDWKDTTFRIANFPAIEDKEIEILKKLFK